MARFFTVLEPHVLVGAVTLVDSLEPVLQVLYAEVDHRTSAHLSALLRGGHERWRMQLFADVQSKSGGPVLELVLMSREPMGQGAPQTRLVFETMLEVVASALPDLQVTFRSDRDGALPQLPDRKVTTESSM